MTMKGKKRNVAKKNQTSGASHISRDGAFSSSFALISNCQSNWKNISVLLNRDPHHEANLGPEAAMQLYSSIALHSSRIKKLKRRVPLSDEAAATRAVNEGKCEFSAPVNLIQNALFLFFSWSNKRRPNNSLRGIVWQSSQSWEQQQQWWTSSRQAWVHILSESPILYYFCK